MKKISIIICLLFCVYFSNAAERYFIQYEPTSCIQQYYYQAITANSNNSSADYYDFHVKLNDKERSVIRTVKERTIPRQRMQLTQKMITCEDKKAHVFQSMVGKIINGEKEVFFVEEDGDSYHIYQALSASYEIYNPEYYYYYTPDHAFQFVYQQDYNPSDKLEMNTANDELTLFAGKSKMSCEEQFGIIQMPSHACSTQVSKEFVRGVGLYIEKNDKAFYKLKSIDKMPIDDYLTWRCNGAKKTGSLANIPKKYDFYNQGNTAKGETKQFDESMIISGYKSNENWAGNAGNTAKGGTETTITQEDNGVYLVSAYKKGNYSSDGNTAKGGETIPKAYDQETAVKVGKRGSRMVDLHTVRDDDTLYNLSKRYNVSIEELQEWNSLEDSTIRIGEELIVKKYPSTL